MSTQSETFLIYRADAIEAATIPYPLRGEDAAQHLRELDQAITDATETEVGQDMLFVEVSVDVAKTACISVCLAMVTDRTIPGAGLGSRQLKTASAKR